MALLKDDNLQDDPWTLASGPDATGTHVIYPLEVWREHREDLLTRNTAIGIRLASDQGPELIAEDIGRFDLIALDFPKFTDGRAYSTARLLRERYGFTGELRAVGHVLRDQYAFLRRVGFNAFDIRDGEDPAQWLSVAETIDDVYQSGADGRATLQRRRQRPRPAVAASASPRPATLTTPLATAGIDVVAANWAY